MADWVFDRIPVDLVELCFQFDDRVGYVGIGRRRPAEENDRVGDLQHFVVLRFLVLVNGRDRDPDASATPINAPNIVSSMSASFRFFAELLPITASVIYHSSTDFSIQKRRFAWEQREFENFAQRKSEMGNSSSAPCVEYEDIIADQGRLNKDVFQKRSHKTGIKFSAGDVLFGKLRPYLKNWLLPDFSGVAVGDFWVLKPSGTDSRFLYYLIQTSEFFSVSNQSAGSKMPRADWNLVSQYAFHIPGEENEQQKIGSLFRRIDALITLHQREYNLRVKD